jgi:hypothetical protein
VDSERPLSVGTRAVVVAVGPSLQTMAKFLGEGVQLRASWVMFLAGKK